MQSEHNEEERHAPDHQSDPARTPGDGWVGEGGASHLGPATHTGAGRPSDDEDAEIETETEATAADDSD